jgi:hypothetical protein
MHAFRLFVFATFLILPASLSAVSVYAVDNAANFGSVDLSTGVFSQIANTGQAICVVGLGELNGLLYTEGCLNNDLYSVNPITGHLTFIGSASEHYRDIGSTMQGLFGIDSSFNLLSINPNSGAVSVIGPTGFTSTTGGLGLSTNSPTLYVTNIGNLYTLNTNTGAATEIGPLLNTFFIDSMVIVNGVLYGGDASHPNIDTLNTATGSATIGPALTGAPVLFGLAPALVPEPGTPWLALGSTSLFVLLRKPRGNHAARTAIR